MMMPFRVGCRRFLEGSHGDRAHVVNDEPATEGYTTLRGTTYRAAIALAATLIWPRATLINTP